MLEFFSQWCQGNWWGDAAYVTFTRRQSLIGLPQRLSGRESTCQAGDAGSTPGLGRSLGEGKGNSLQYSCLEKYHVPSQGTVHGVTKSQTCLSNWAQNIIMKTRVLSVWVMAWNRALKRLMWEVRLYQTSEIFFFGGGYLLSQHNVVYPNTEMI